MLTRWKVNYVRGLSKVVALMTLMVFSCGLWAEAGMDNVPGQQMLSAMNQVRASSGLPPLKEDSRLQETARFHLLEFVKHQQISYQFEGEPSLGERLKTAQVSFGAAGEVMLKLPDLDTVSDQLLNNDETRKVVLDPRYSVAGFAAMRSGQEVFIVGDLVQLAASLSVEAAERAVVDAVQRARAEHKLRPVTAVPMNRLRNVACDMAKKDSLKIAPINPYREYLGAPSPNVFSLTLATSDPATLPQSIQNLRGDPKINTLSVGVCHADSPNHPNGAYWIVMLFYAK